MLIEFLYDRNDDDIENRIRKPVNGMTLSLQTILSTCSLLVLTSVTPKLPKLFILIKLRSLNKI